MTVGNKHETMSEYKYAIGHSTFAVSTLQNHNNLRFFLHEDRDSKKKANIIWLFIHKM